MSLVTEDQKILITKAMHCINDTAGWVALDGKTENVSGLSINLRSSINVLSQYVEGWRICPITKASNEVDGVGADFTRKVISALIQAVPEDTTDNEFSSSGAVYNWYEDNRRCAEYLLRLFAQLQDSVRKRMFSQQVAAMAELQEIEGCTGANFVEGELPWGNHSVDLAELKSFMHNFANKVMFALR